MIHYVYCQAGGCLNSRTDASVYCEEHLIMRSVQATTTAEYLNEQTEKELDKWVDEQAPAIPTAPQILKTAIGHMEERAATYDQPQGERSMGKTVAMFNTLTEHGLTEEQGWLFMACLKMVRAQAGRYRADSYEDGAAYFALAGESAAQERV
jgi:hypothetical protein